jgi:hypothetical protein
MERAYVGIDVAFAKRKRLPIVVSTLRESRLEPLPLRCASEKPPVGKGNEATLDDSLVSRFAEDTADYLRAVESAFKVSICCVAIDAPSMPKIPGRERRRCEVELDRNHIHCISTPSLAEFVVIRKKAAQHLLSRGAASHLPAANQLWMLVRFELFRVLRRNWECIEVFPQAIAAFLNASDRHKSTPEGLLAQLKAVSHYTHWPVTAEVLDLSQIAYGSPHDRLDAYLSAWVASLAETNRLPLGLLPDDAIWVPHLPQHQP